MLIGVFKLSLWLSFSITFGVFNSFYFNKYEKSSNFGVNHILCHKFLLKEKYFRAGSSVKINSYTVPIMNTNFVIHL